MLNPIPLRTAKTLWSFGLSERNRVNSKNQKQQQQKNIKTNTQIYNNKKCTQLSSLQASCKSFQVILVGTFLDKMDITPEDKKEEIAKLNALIELKIPYARESLQLCPVSCINSEGR